MSDLDRQSSPPPEEQPAAAAPAAEEYRAKADGAVGREKAAEPISIPKRRSRSRSPGNRDRRRNRSHSRERRRSSRSRSPERRRHRSRSDERRRERRRSRSPPTKVERAPVYEPQRVVPPQAGGVAAAPPAGLVAGLPTGGLAGIAGMAGLPGMAGMMAGMGQAAAGVNQATRPARRLYVGGLPRPCYDFMLSTFLNNALLALGICKHVPGKNPIVNCTVTQERQFAFIEFHDINDCTAALQLDGIPFMGNSLKIKRPKDYAATYGAPPDPPPLSPLVMAQVLAQNAEAAAAGGAAAMPQMMPGMVLPGMMPGMPGQGWP